MSSGVVQYHSDSKEHEARVQRLFPRGIPQRPQGSDNPYGEFAKYLDLLEHLRAAPQMQRWEHHMLECLLVRGTPEHGPVAQAFKRAEDAFVQAERDYQQAIHDWAVARRSCKHGVTRHRGTGGHRECMLCGVFLLEDNKTRNADGSTDY